MRKHILIGLLSVCAVCGLTSSKSACKECGGKVKQEKNFTTKRYNGHTYVVYSKSAMVHDPDCKCQFMRYYNGATTSPLYSKQAQAKKCREYIQSEAKKYYDQAPAPASCCPWDDRAN